MLIDARRRRSRRNLFHSLEAERRPLLWHAARGYFVIAVWMARVVGDARRAGYQLVYVSDNLASSGELALGGFSIWRSHHAFLTCMNTCGAPQARRI